MIPLKCCHCNHVKIDNFEPHITCYKIIVFYTLYFCIPEKNNIISNKNIILFCIANTRCSLHEHARPDRPVADFIPSLLILDSADSNFTKFSLLIIWYIFLYTLVALSLKNQYPFLRAIPHYRRHKMCWEDCHNIYSRTESDKSQHKNAVVAVVERQTSLFCLIFVQKILLYIYMYKTQQILGKCN